MQNVLIKLLALLKNNFEPKDRTRTEGGVYIGGRGIQLMPTIGKREVKDLCTLPRHSS